MIALNVRFVLCDQGLVFCHMSAFISYYIFLLWLDSLDQQLSLGRSHCRVCVWWNNICLMHYHKKLWANNAGENSKQQSVHGRLHLVGNTVMHMVICFSLGKWFEFIFYLPNCHNLIFHQNYVTAKWKYKCMCSQILWTFQNIYSFLLYMYLINNMRRWIIKKKKKTIGKLMTPAPGIQSCH